MMEKLAQADEGEGCTPTHFTLFTITYEVAVYASAERAVTLPLFHLYPSVGLGNWSGGSLILSKLGRKYHHHRMLQK
jgi:hypothetical protein